MQEAATTRPAGYQNWGGGRLGAGEASDPVAAQVLGWKLKHQLDLITSAPTADGTIWQDSAWSSNPFEVFWS